MIVDSNDYNSESHAQKESVDNVLTSEAMEDLKQVQKERMELMLAESKSHFAKF